jgi:hypothetical protein
MASTRRKSLPLHNIIGTLRAAGFGTENSIEGAAVVELISAHWTDLVSATIGQRAIERRVDDMTIIERDIKFYRGQVEEEAACRRHCMPQDEKLYASRLDACIAVVVALKEYAALLPVKGSDAVTASL